MPNDLKFSFRQPNNREHIVRIARRSLAVLGAVAVVSTTTLATPPAGVVSNVILAQGATVIPLKEKITVGDNWSVNLEDKGQSDFYFQDLVVGPGGRTGWHSHPGLLLITVKEGSVDFYDKDCVKRTYGAGQSFSESAEPHNALNWGSGNAHLLIAYIVKKGEPRRIESAQPKCGEALGLL
jgi:quercetin dioxygenase-like cupin family protein